MLKSCPFCGEVPDRVKSWESLTDHKIIYVVACNNLKCAITPVTKPYKTRAGALRAWNKRA